jgi:membrane protein required for colicin V production
MVGWLDIVLAVVLGGALIAGLVRGLVKEVIGILAAVIAFFVASREYGPVARFFGKSIHDATVTKFLAFIVVFVVIVGIGYLLAIFLSKVMVGPLKFINHLLGGVFGLVEGGLIGGALVFALTVFPVSANAIAQSKIAPYCYGFTKAMVQMIPQDLKDEFKKSYENLMKKENPDGQKI